MSERILYASIDGNAVGVVREAAGIWAFEYATTWVVNPRAFALAPSLPLRAGEHVDGSTLRPVQWYFDNLLPEEAQRDLLAAEAKLPAADSFGLLAWYGAESAGSLTLLPAPEIPASVGGFRPLPDTELSARIGALPRTSLAYGAAKRMSLAGAQHKLPVVLREDQLLEPLGAAASTHLLKPDHPSPDYPHSAVNEWFVMSLAKAAGLAVPVVARRYVPQPVYLVERFDRADGTRLHAVDACQLLGLDRSFKYAEGSIATLARIAMACRSSAVARTSLFEWVVFNLLTGNSDAHLKNLSFLVSAEGIQLAPFYDLLAVGVYESPVFGQQGWPGTTPLAWPLPLARRFGELSRTAVVDAGCALGLSRTTATRVLEQLCRQLPTLTANLVARTAAENMTLVAARPALAPTLGGEMRCLRALQHAVVLEMVRRLGRG